MIRKLFTLLLLCLPAYAQQVNTFIPFGGTNVQTATYVIQAADVGKLVVMNCSSCTVSLPSSIPTGYNSQWAVWILNLNATALTVSPNGLNLNGSASSASLVQNAYYYITTSPSAYYGVTAGNQPPGSGGTIPGVLFPSRFSYIFGRGDGITSFGHGVGALGTQSAFAITGTEESGRILSATAAGSTNTVLAICSAVGANPGQGFLSMGTFQRFVMRIETQVSSTARYWVGLMDFSAAECASGNSTWVSDAPNRNYCAFRFSSTTDTTWKAICATSNVATTVVDTGVAINTAASVLFEIITTPTSASFSINGAPVATITTNIPAASFALADGFQVDNKNTATAESVAFFWSQTFENK